MLEQLRSALRTRKWRAGRMSEQTLIPGALTETFACPACGEPRLGAIGGRAVCAACDGKYSFENGILDLLVDKELKTQLDTANYNVRHNISDATVDSVGKGWLGILQQIGADIEDARVLEIGAGSGVLSVGLLRHSRLSHLFATDVSNEFLQTIVDAAGGDDRLFATRCDGNRIPVVPQSVDLVFGRSILHHLVDYEETLKCAATALKDGGTAVFFEPIIDGKVVIAHSCALLIGMNALMAEPVFNQDEINILMRTQRHITKGAWYPQDRDSIAKLEDKYIFDIDQLTDVGRRIGFQSVEFMEPPRPAHVTTWRLFVNTVTAAGIPGEKLDQFAFVGEAFQDTWGAVLPQRVVAPMGYFVFRK
jgi:ubiquinone/menaquinone biosynthesis C-methylase UbiE